MEGIKNSSINKHIEDENARGYVEGVKSEAERRRVEDESKLISFLEKDLEKLEYRRQNAGVCLENLLVLQDIADQVAEHDPDKVKYTEMSKLITELGPIQNSINAGNKLNALNQNIVDEYEKKRTRFDQLVEEFAPNIEDLEPLFEMVDQISKIKGVDQEKVTRVCKLAEELSSLQVFINDGSTEDVHGVNLKEKYKQKHDEFYRLTEKYRVNVEDLSKLKGKADRIVDLDPERSVEMKRLVKELQFLQKTINGGGQMADGSDPIENYKSKRAVLDILMDEMGIKSVDISTGSNEEEKLTEPVPSKDNANILGEGVSGIQKTINQVSEEFEQLGKGPEIVVDPVAQQRMQAQGLVLDDTILRTSRGSDKEIDLYYDGENRRIDFVPGDEEGVVLAQVLEKSGRVVQHEFRDGAWNENAQTIIAESVNKKNEKLPDLSLGFKQEAMPNDFAAEVKAEADESERMAVEEAEKREYLEKKKVFKEAQRAYYDALKQDYESRGVLTKAFGLGRKEMSSFVQEKYDAFLSANNAFITHADESGYYQKIINKFNERTERAENPADINSLVVDRHAFRPARERLELQKRQMPENLQKLGGKISGFLRNHPAAAKMAKGAGYAMKVLNPIAAGASFLTGKGFDWYEEGKDRQHEEQTAVATAEVLNQGRSSLAELMANEFEALRAKDVRAMSKGIAQKGVYLGASGGTAFGVADYFDLIDGDLPEVDNEVGGALGSSKTADITGGDPTVSFGDHEGLNRQSDLGPEWSKEALNAAGSPPVGTMTTTPIADVGAPQTSEAIIDGADTKGSVSAGEKIPFGSTREVEVDLAGETILSKEKADIIRDFVAYDSADMLNDPSFQEQLHVALQSDLQVVDHGSEEFRKVLQQVQALDDAAKQALLEKLGWSDLDAQNAFTEKTSGVFEVNGEEVEAIDSRIVEPAPGEPTVDINSPQGEQLAEQTAEFTEARVDPRVESLVAEIRDTPSYEVQSGDNIWKIIENKLEAHDLFNGLEEGQKLHMIDELKDRVETMSPEELKEFGVGSGDPNVIRPGETLDFSKIMGEDSVTEAVEHADGLSEAQIDSVEANKPLVETPTAPAAPERVIVETVQLDQSGDMRYQMPSGVGENTQVEVINPFLDDPKYVANGGERLIDVMTENINQNLASGKLTLAPGVDVEQMIKLKIPELVPVDEFSQEYGNLVGSEGFKPRFTESEWRDLTGFGPNLVDNMPKGAEVDMSRLMQEVFGLNSPEAVDTAEFVGRRAMANPTAGMESDASQAVASETVFRSEDTSREGGVRDEQWTSSDGKEKRTFYQDDHSVRSEYRYNSEGLETKGAPNAGAENAPPVPSGTETVAQSLPELQPDITGYIEQKGIEIHKFPANAPKTAMYNHLAKMIDELPSDLRQKYAPESISMSNGHYYVEKILPEVATGRRSFGGWILSPFTSPTLSADEWRLAGIPSGDPLKVAGAELDHTKLLQLLAAKNKSV